MAKLLRDDDSDFDDGIVERNKEMEKQRIMPMLQLGYILSCRSEVRMVDLMLSVLVVILPTLFAVGIEFVSKEIREHRYWRKGVILFGVLLSALTWIQIARANTSHEREISHQHVDIENLRGDLHRSETERHVSDAYLRAKLEDAYQMNAQLAQLGPALLKLANTSAEFERKQFEQKITSNKELQEFTMSVVKKIRDFSQKYERLQRQQTDEMVSSTRDASSDAERDRRWNEGIQKEIQLSYGRDSEFRSSILPDALYARSELLKKKIAEPPLEPVQRFEIKTILRGSVSGIRSELALADYLELMARQLQSK